ncbi:MarR family transcriptional regulator [Burkholderia cenocepacia]|uniref:helix-turn-helix transcriptional regulator n=1 Tax=Burkholderia cenocepacia TaxID=95486 RepID=UPI0009B7FB70|nr:MarR family transcriptional regulator [Burkholderia cenocepacia]MCG0583066.1 MarR family transcriptional regulator [Burkholderia cenocepacia]MCW3524463.1 MarR family transcriptional regulator [Burkholderia cenocepacia]MCW3614685.1 MarR family transcriptional regulator [Burkholderia cenocepacia]MCW3652623.1 MarR family transcriptional regulator [Burkholderia cenocepacia]MCW3667595.1 MarR family transcriptional regulator [Burkholderia cenocepacia]
MTTKNDVLRALQRESLTVEQLCDQLSVTRTAINVQLKQLEAEGLVRRRKPVQTGTPGKPATVYDAAPGSEDAASRAYPAFLLSLLATLRDRLDDVQLEEILTETGRRLAREGNQPVSRDFDTNLANAMAIVDALGAQTEAVADGDAVVVRNFSCPVGSAVRETPCVCRAIAAYFSEATGRPATEECLRGGRLVCQYRITNA